MNNGKSGIMTILALIALAVAGYLIKVQLDNLPYETTEDKIVHYIAWGAYAMFCIVCLALLSIPRNRRRRR